MAIGEIALRKVFEIGDRARHVKSGATGTVIAIEVDSYGQNALVVPDADKLAANWHSLNDLIPIREADQIGGWRLQE